MKSTINGFSNERLESEISNVYYTAVKDGMTPARKEALILLWEEFDERLEVGALSADTDWTEKRWDD